jgi:hypothetical protein
MATLAEREWKVMSRTTCDMWPETPVETAQPLWLLFVRQTSESAEHQARHHKAASGLLSQSDSALHKGSPLLSKKRKEKTYNLQQVKNSETQKNVIHGLV